MLPGLIDCHTHLGSRADRYDEIYKFKDTPFHSAFAAVKNAETTLKAGFTTVRDLGGKPFLAVDLRNSIDEGFLVGPRIVASGPGISMTGGHGDLNNYAPQVRVAMFPDERDYRIADGPDQVRHVVRAQLKHGVDVIKIHATGGVMSRGDQPGAPQFTVEELRAAVEEAHAAGRKVAAHAHGAQGIKNAVIAGVDSIEHGSLIDDEGIRMMVASGTWLVADIYNDDYILGKAREFKISEESIAKEKALGQIQRDNFARAVKAGVKVAFGTDAGVYPHGDNAKQFAYMVKYGLTPARAIRSATADAAELLGRAQRGRPDRPRPLRRPDRRRRRPAPGRPRPRVGRLRDEGGPGRQGRPEPQGSIGQGGMRGKLRQAGAPGSRERRNPLLQHSALRRFRSRSCSLPVSVVEC